VAFLRAAFKIADGAIYSLHKTSTRAHIEKVAKTKFHAREAEVLAQLRYDLPATYAHHREKSVEIAVDLWRFEPTPGAVIDDDALELELADDAVEGLARDLTSKAHVRGRGGRRGGRRGARSGRGK
jgi:putative methylase